MTKAKHPTQAQMVIEYIREFGSITQLDALRDLSIMRLASRISELRKNGYDIISKREAVKNRYGRKSYIKRYSERSIYHGHKKNR